MIRFDNVTFHYKQKSPLFNKMSFELGSGKIYGLLGLNGAGKTTAIKIMAGLLNPIEGDCSLYDSSTFKRYPETLSKLFYVSEEFYLPKGKVEDYEKLYSVYYPSFIHDEFYGSLKEFGIEREDNIHDMSYGQKKKVLICFGIAANTELLLLDEPTNGLDIPSKAIFRKLIASAVTENRCIVISTHQVLDVENLIDHFLIINEGKMILNASSTTLTEKLAFQAITGDEIDEDILYSKDNQKGQKAIIRNKENDESKIDIELLFTGVLENEKILNEF